MDFLYVLIGYGFKLTYYVALCLLVVWIIMALMALVCWFVN